MGLTFYCNELDEIDRASGHCSSCHEDEELGYEMCWTTHEEDELIRCCMALSDKDERNPKEVFELLRENRKNRLEED